MAAKHSFQSASSRGLARPGPQQVAPRQLASHQPRFLTADLAGVSFRAGVNRLYQHRWAIGVIFILVFGYIIADHFLKTPIYRSTGSVQFGYDQANVTGIRDVPANNTYSQDYLWNQLQLLRSQQIAEQVAATLELDSVAQLPSWGAGGITARVKRQLASLKRMIKQGVLALTAANTPVSSLSAPQTVQTGVSTEALQHRAVAAQLRNGISLEPIEKTRILKLHFNSPDAAFAARVVDAWVEAFIELNNQRRFMASAVAREALNERLAQVRVNLTESEQLLSAHAQQLDVIDFEHKEQELLQKINRLQAAISKIESEQARTIAETAELRESGRDETLAEFYNPALERDKKQLIDLETQYQVSRKTYKPGYPLMQQLQQQIEQTRARIEATLAELRQSSQSRFDVNLRATASLRQLLKQREEELLELRSHATEYLALKRDLDTNRQLFNALLQRIKEVGVAAGTLPGNIMPLDAASMPTEPFLPRIEKQLEAGLIVSVLLSLAVVFLLEQFDTRLRSPAQLSRLAQLPLLGVVPALGRRKSRKARRFDVAAQVMQEPYGTIAEVYRECRTALALSSTAGMPKVLHVTSAMKGEGKSTSLMSLAVILAMEGKRVLMIDADMRNPSLHIKAGMDNEIGLSNCLVGEVTSSQAIQAMGDRRPDLITCGPRPPNPAELIDSTNMRLLLTSCQKSYDCILIDSPPVIGLADALLLASLSEMTLFIADIERARTKPLQAALQRLRAANANLGGIIVTNQKGSNQKGSEEIN